MSTILRQLLTYLRIRSLQAANCERGEADIRGMLEAIVPDIQNQYTTFKIDPGDRFYNLKVRCQHAFQVSLMLRTIGLLKESLGERAINVVDIGDSAGTHLAYLVELGARQHLKLNTMSVNLDPQAVERIRARGLNAQLGRAEELHSREDGFKADLFMLFEVLEHFFDPISFLRGIATKTECKYLLLTVPYVISSRVGLHYLRRESGKRAYAENTHIFELCPEDWNLIFQFSGWRITYSDRYTQYPNKGPLNWMKYDWRRSDFDGFYGVILQKDLTLSNLYQDW